MPSKQTQEQQKIVGRVMHEFKHGELRAAGGREVRDRRQAVAIALSEAGSSNQQSPAQKRRALKRTEARQRGAATGAAGEPTRAELYERAKRAGIAGRSRMRKAELERALGGARR